MGARNGNEFLEGLRDDREIWLGGERIGDVTTHPALRGAACAMAGLYDLQFEQPELLLMTDAVTGEQVNVTHLIPRSGDDLARRHSAIRRIAESTLGLMGRSPDYLNVTMAGFAGRSDVWARNGNEQGAENLVRFQREAAINDWSMTHAIVNPTIDKTMREVDTGDGRVVLHKVSESAEGIVVSGARALATLAPFADEMVIYPGQPIPRDASDYALAFSVPMATPGIKVLCRDSFSLGGPRSDHPFSTRYDEQDAVVIFDEVLVPHDRVFLDGDTEVYNKAMTTGWAANIMQQTTIRAHVKLDFAWQLATRMAEVLKAESATTIEQLGEIWSYAGAHSSRAHCRRGACARMGQWRVVLCRTAVPGATTDAAPVDASGQRDHQAHRRPQPPGHTDTLRARQSGAAAADRPVLHRGRCRGGDEDRHLPHRLGSRRICPCGPDRTV